MKLPNQQKTFIKLFEQYSGPRFPELEAFVDALNYLYNTLYYDYNINFQQKTDIFQVHSLELYHLALKYYGVSPVLGLNIVNTWDEVSSTWDNPGGLVLWDNFEGGYYSDDILRRVIRYNQDRLTSIESVPNLKRLIAEFCDVTYEEISIQFTNITGLDIRIPAVTGGERAQAFVALVVNGSIQLPGECYLNSIYAV